MSLLNCARISWPLTWFGIYPIRQHVWRNIPLLTSALFVFPDSPGENIIANLIFLSLGIPKSTVLMFVLSPA